MERKLHSSIIIQTYFIQSHLPNPWMRKAFRSVKCSKKTWFPEKSLRISLIHLSNMYIYTNYSHTFLFPCEKLSIFCAIGDICLLWASCCYERNILFSIYDEAQFTLTSYVHYLRDTSHALNILLQACEFYDRIYKHFHYQSESDLKALSISKPSCHKQHQNQICWIINQSFACSYRWMRLISSQVGNIRLF